MEEDSWKRLSAAIGFYTVHGFELLDVPWTVNSVYSSMTKPPGRNDFWLKDKVLVASAEQSFVQLYDKKKLDPNKFYCAITPCFRDEPVLDDLHQLYFMKVELFKIFQSSTDFFKVLETAKIFFSQFVKCRDITMDLANETVIEHRDIVTAKHQIELGSYMIHDKKGMKWCCGTGLAEPRLTKAIKKEK